VFDFQKLVEFLRLNFENLRIINEGKTYKNIFNLDYGLVDYGCRKSTSLIKNNCLPNPLEPVFFKDKIYEEDNEFRICLSAIGMGKFILGDKEFNFPDSIALSFNFQEANQQGVINCIEILSNFNPELKSQLEKLLKNVKFKYLNKKKSTSIVTNCYGFIKKIYNLLRMVLLK